MQPFCRVWGIQVNEPEVGPYGRVTQGLNPRFTLWRDTTHYFRTQIEMDVMVDYLRSVNLEVFVIGEVHFYYSKSHLIDVLSGNDVFDWREE